MTTTENNNKLIAEFMGYEIIYRPNSNGFIEISDTELCDVDDLEYHKSWDWLMPVVEKIEEITIEDNNMTIKSHRFLVEIVLGSCEIYDSVSSSVVGSGDYGNKLDSTYNAVVEFIKWYNNQ